MSLRSLASICLTLLTAFALSAANGPQDQTTQTPPATSLHSSEEPSATIMQRGTSTPLPVPPSLAEMRKMTAEQLDSKGDELRQVKDYLSAVDCYREAIRKHASADYYNKIAISELLLKQPQEAEKAAKRALKKNKHLAEAWNNLAVTYYMRSRYVDAINAYQRAISLKPDFASFHNNLAAALMDSNQPDRAMIEYRKAYVLDPTFFDHASRNGISAHMGSPQDRAQFSYVMAKLFAANGDLEHALHFLRSAIEDGYPKIDQVYRDKEFAQVVTDERFVALMKERPVAIR